MGVTKVKIINKSWNKLPEYKTALSAGMDLRAWLPEDKGYRKQQLTLYPGDRAVVGTGLYIELPEGTEAQVRSRSGLSLEHGIVVLNSPGTIDADYRGEVGVILYNKSEVPYTVNDGDRIAQMVVAPYVRVEWEDTTELSDTERGAGGYGSTGR